MKNKKYLWLWLTIAVAWLAMLTLPGKATAKESTEIRKRDEFKELGEALGSARGYLHQRFESVTIFAPGDWSTKYVVTANGDARDVMNMTSTATIAAGCTSVLTSYPEEPRVTREEAAEVVKALEILLRYAPEKYEGQCAISSTGIVMSGNWYTSATTRRTKADAVREEGKRLEAQAYEKETAAKKMDDEQAEIEWARGVLEKWKRKAGKS